MKKFKNYLLLSLIGFLPLAIKVEASFLSGLQTAAGQSGVGMVSLEDNIVALINGLLSLVGLVFIIMIILGGFKWMTSQGNSEKVTQAKEMIKNAIIGITVVLLSYTIVSAVYNIIMAGQA